MFETYKYRDVVIIFFYLIGSQGVCLRVKACIGTEGCDGKVGRSRGFFRTDPNKAQADEYQKRVSPIVHR